MSIDPVKAKREAEIRANLPADVVALADAAMQRPGALFEPDALALIRDMRANNPAQWTDARALFKSIPDVQIGDLVRMTAPPGGESDGKHGRVVEWNDPEPCPEPVDGAVLLDDKKGLVEHYASLPAGGAAAVALWSLYTWVFDAFGVSPNLMITAPERESGKTRVTELLSWMVRRPKPVSDASAAAIIRGIERDRPTLLLDEAQSFLRRKGEDPIRGILLASFVRRFASVERVARDPHDEFEVREFSTFTPKAMNGRDLAQIDDMLTSRSIVLAMTRAHRRLPEIRADRDPVGIPLRQRCARWAADHAAALRETDPDMGERIGRSADVWRPLFAIADEVGGDWRALVREAADLLDASAAKVTDGGFTYGVMLLADVRKVFGDQPRIKSDDLDRALYALPDRPWATYGQGDKPMTAQARGRLLKRYGIKSKELRFPDGTRLNGYERAQFDEAWNSYLPGDTGNSNGDMVTTLENKRFPRTSNHDNGSGCHGSESAGNATNTGFVTMSPFNIPGSGGNGAEPAPDRVPLPKQSPGSATLGDAYRLGRDGE